MMHGMNKEGLYRGALGRMIEVLRQHRSLMVYIKGSPDPDALASAFAIKSLCEMLGVKAEMVASVEPSLAQNKEIIKIDINNATITELCRLPGIGKSYAKKIIDSEQGSNLRIEIEPIAFGLNAVNLTFTREETLDSDILIEKLRKINGVASGEIIDFRRAFG